MKLPSKLAALVSATALVATLTACGGTSNSASTPTSSTSVPPEEKTYTIGICQLVQHQSLDAATQGFQDALREKLGDRVSFDYQNASGDSPTCTTIIGGFVSKKVDLILANATAPLQSAAAATTEIPILGTSVTDYATALDSDDWTGTTGRNISGTADLAPLDGQAAMVKELFPNAKTVGILYCSAEPNSKYQSTLIQKYLGDLGYTTREYTFSDSNDLAGVASTAATNSDVIYIPTDNTAAANAELIKNVVLPTKVPIITGDEGTCSVCGVASLAISYYDLGYQTGEMAYEILENGGDISTMPVRSAPSFKKLYNPQVCTALGITPPEGYTPIG